MPTHAAQIADLTARVAALESRQADTIGPLYGRLLLATAQYLAVLGRGSHLAFQEHELALAALLHELAVRVPPQPDP